MRKSAIVLLSGGQDSATCLFWASREFEKIYAISFDYGQRHAAELEAARELAKLAGVLEHRVVEMRGLLSGSSLTDHSIDHNQEHKSAPGLPSSFTAGRNILFLTLAASWGHGLGVKSLVTGVCQTDFSGYPDCRRDFINEMESALSLGLYGQKFATDDLVDFSKAVGIFTPLMHLTKAETWKMAGDMLFEDIKKGATVDILEIIRTKTMTDYNGDRTQNDWGMGKEDNPASVLRAKGYREAVEKGWIPQGTSAW